MFRDTSMDYLSRDEVLEIWNNNMRLTDEQLLAMDETESRSRASRLRRWCLVRSQPTGVGRRGSW